MCVCVGGGGGGCVSKLHEEDITIIIYFFHPRGKLKLDTLMLLFMCLLHVIWMASLETAAVSVRFL